MIDKCSIMILLTLVALSFGWKVPLRQWRSVRTHHHHRHSKTKVQLSKTWDVTLRFNGEEKIVNVNENQILLEVAESVFSDPPYNCRQGVCYACIAQTISGKENIMQDPNLLGQKALDRGIICSCQAHVTGPGVVVQLGAFDEKDSFDE